MIDDSGRYEERADYLTDNEIFEWNVENDHFREIQERLIDKGSKVIVGPRGCGKTHQMRIAYKKCISESNNPFPLYVSFSRYYFLEPMLSKDPEAIKNFHTWVLSLIVLACNTTYKELQQKNIELSLKIEDIELFVAQSEKGIKQPWHSNIINAITLPFVMNLIEQTAERLKRKRSILLLDDAALTLTKEYMVEFFDIFRTLKSKKISPKASVYPGTTEYGPRFHLKQDGDPYNVWFNPLEKDFLEFTNTLLTKRFLEVDLPESILELLKYAAFGNPRAFITLVRDYIESDKTTQQSKFNSVIETRCKLLRAEYESIKQKLTQYNTIIEVGSRFFEAITNEMSNLNRNNLESPETRRLIIGLAPSKSSIYNRMMNFLIEAGLLYELETVKHGEDRSYKRYIPHLCFLFEKNSFSMGKGFNASKIVEYLELKDSKHPLRKDNINPLIGGDVESILKLDLPNCTSCGAIRLSENQKFCHACGMELVIKSTFEQCMEIDVIDLPLTDWQKNKIITETSIKKVKDFVNSSNIGEELQKPIGIGKKKAETIANKVNRWIEEFLE